MNNLATFDRGTMTITVRLDGKKELAIGKKDVEISYFSGGPGGQNVNRSMNGVRLIYHIPQEHRRNAARTRELVTRSMNQRSQEQNLVTAFAQLAEKLSHYFYLPPARRPTKISKGAKKRRMDDKKRIGRKKAERKMINY